MITVFEWTAALLHHPAEGSIVNCSLRRLPNSAATPDHSISCDPLTIRILVWVHVYPCAKEADQFLLPPKAAMPVLVLHHLINVYPCTGTEQRCRQTLGSWGSPGYRGYGHISRRLKAHS
jgi:hypothetical protein